MIKINLLPVRQTRKAESLRREAVLAGLFGAIILGGCMVIWAGLGIQLSKVKSDNAVLNAEIAKLAEDVQRVDEMEKFKAELERKLAVIADLRSRKAGPAHMLDELALATPEKLQLSEVREHGGAMNIVGVAVSNEVISQFLRSLEASDYVEQVYLQDIEALDIKQGSSTIVLKKFSLTARRNALAAEVPSAPVPAGAAAPPAGKAGATPAAPGIPAVPAAATATVPGGAAAPPAAPPAAGATP